jgi:hypothetical protein
MTLNKLHHRDSLSFSMEWKGSWYLASHPCRAVLQVRWEKLCFIDVADITMHVLHIGYKQEEGLVIINLKFIAFSDLMIVNLRWDFWDIVPTIKLQRVWPGIVAQVCNPSYSGGRDQEDHDSRSAQARIVCKIPSHPIKSWVWWCTPIIPTIWEV